MHIFIACNSCGARYPAESHAGLLRCTPCDNRLAFRLQGRGPLVLEIHHGPSTQPNHGVIQEVLPLGVAA